MTDTPTAAMIVVGDEVLSGRTQDANTQKLAKMLNEQGIDLCEARAIRDDHDVIVETVNALRGRYTYVFTSGGIGPTHDDIAAEAVAAAMETPIGIRDDARAILVGRYGEGADLTDARLRMARIPDGAALIDNPVSVAPGFTLGNVHVMAGVPKVFQAMVASVLATLTGGAPLVSASVRVDRGEGDIAQPLSDLAAAYPDLSFGSYPFQSAEGRFGANVVVRGQDAARVGEAEAALRATFA